MTTEKKQERVCLGAIVGVHGIRGELKVKSWTASERDIDNYGVLENEDGTRLFELKVVGRSKELLRCKIKGIEERNAAEALIGTALYVKREALPELEEDEFYQADLIGLEVVNQASGRVEGKVAGLYNFGAGDILEIALADTKKTELIPFTRRYVPEVDVKAGRIVVASMLMNFADDDDNAEGAADEN